MKCSVPPFFASSIAFFHAAPSNIFPEVMASETSLAPWAQTRPAPIALWPTSELPMSASDGRPTAVPWAFSSVYGMVFISLWRNGEGESSTASPSLYFPMPTPSMMVRTTGPFLP